MSTTATGIRLVGWSPDLEAATVDVLSRAFESNPLHVAAFGPTDVTVRNRVFFQVGLTLFHGRRLVALDGDRVVGFAHWVDVPGCRLSAARRLSLVPAMLRGFGLRPTLRVGAWLSAWARNDPPGRHSHLGPIGVDPRAQGKGIGRLMMESYCSALDEAAAVGYLETDRPENVEFYCRFGFEVLRSVEVIGVPSYFMSRPSRR